ncbi:GNAT family N-acetyltransferase [Patulibacter sp.]|uniref:GNAT family N-acetyltransferase n=1 Tax=Patulibacter sp. TaxID=1912859 RepID=UPI0027204AAF|nr:GNAT family N-acetyltransferase [Patulibacter sp.]MDO9409817.1 GNAT family N-acetyltransferase [Patulibacter sp.]
MSLVARLSDRIRSTVDGRRGAALPVPPVGFTDGTIALRQWRPSDGLHLATLCDDDEIRRWTSVPHDYRTHQAAGRAAFAEAERLAGRGVHLAVTDAHDAVLLGAVDLVVPGQGRERGRVSFLLGPASRGQGHATRAVRLLDGWAFGAVGTSVLEIRPQADNAAAVAVAERAGFAAETSAGPGADGRLTFVRHAGDPTPAAPQG